MNELSDLVLPTPSRRGILLAAGAGSALLALSGCKSAAKDKDSGSSAKPKRGGTLTIAHPVDFVPSLLFAPGTPAVHPRLLFNTLTRYDEHLKPQPELAKSWTYAKDNKSITLQLRDDVKYHDGRPFTADDVIWAIKNLQDPARGSQLRATASAIKSLTKHGDHALTLTLAHPISNLFDLFEYMIIADRKTVDDALKGKKLNGTGPFKLKSWDAGSSLTLTRNTHYWVPGRPYLDSVVIRVISQASMLSSLRSGQSQITYSLDGRSAGTLKKDAKFSIEAVDMGASSLYVGANVKHPHLKDKKVRQAIAYAVDRNRIVDQLMGGYGLATSAPWPKSSPAYSASAAHHYTHNPGKARELLKSAGASKITLPLDYGASTAGSAMAEMLQYDLKQVGITVKLQPSSDSASFQKKLLAGQMEGLWWLSHNFAAVQPATLPLSAYPYNVARNSSNFHSKEYTELAEQAWMSPDPDSAKTRAVYKQLTDLVLDEAFVIELALLPTTQVSSAKVHGATLNKFSFVNLDNAFLS